MRRRAMWAAPRPLRRVGFVERCCSPGLPLVWSALFVHDTAGGFLADGWGVTLVVVYVVVVAWHGSLQELSARGGVRRRLALAELREWALRGANTLADVSATLTGLFFLLRWFAAAWFAPLFLVALTAHAGVQVVVARRLRALHGRPGYWGGRAPAAREVPPEPHVHFAVHDDGESARSDA